MRGGPWRWWRWRWRHGVLWRDGSGVAITAAIRRSVAVSTSSKLRARGAAQTHHRALSFLLELISRSGLLVSCSALLSNPPTSSTTSSPTSRKMRPMPRSPANPRYDFVLLPFCLSLSLLLCTRRRSPGRPFLHPHHPPPPPPPSVLTLTPCAGALVWRCRLLSPGESRAEPAPTRRRQNRRPDRWHHPGRSPARRPRRERNRSLQSGRRPCCRRPDHRRCRPSLHHPCLPNPRRRCPSGPLRPHGHPYRTGTSHRWDHWPAA